MKNLTIVSLVLAAVIGVRIVHAASVPALPGTSATVVFHLDATDLDGDGTAEGYGESGLQTNHYVITWADKGTMHADVTQADPYRRPLYFSSGFGTNGAKRAFVRFTAGEPDYLQALTNFSGTQGLVAIVFRSRSAGNPNYQYEIFSMSQTNTGVYYARFCDWGASGSPGNPSMLFQFGPGSANLPYYNGTITPYDQVTRTFCISDGSSYGLMQNGVNLPVSMYPGYGIDNGLWFDGIDTVDPQVITVGGLNYGGGVNTAFAFNGDIAEIVVVEGNLSSNEVTALDDYFAGKYFTAPPSGLPATSANVLFHLDASDLDGNGIAEGMAEATLTGSKVETWVNTGSAGFSVSQTNAANQPVYYTAGFGTNGVSRPYLEFVGASNTYLTAAGGLDGTQGTVIIVFRSRSPGGDPSYYHGLFSATSSDGNWFLRFADWGAESGSGNPSIWYMEDGGTVNICVGPTATPYNRVTRDYWTTDGSKWSVGQNGSLEMATEYPGYGTNGGWWFGDCYVAYVDVGHCRYVSPSWSTLPFQGDIAEIIVYDAKLSSADFIRVDNRLAVKYCNIARGTAIIIY